MIRRLIVGATITSAAMAAYTATRRWYESWGVDATETIAGLPGDELVPAPDLIDTRGISIEAPPSAVWPWLAQLGYGRGGWYSYDALDMKGTSATTILPEHQRLAVGDLVATDPGGGFVARIVEPEQALVLFVDPEILATRTDAPATTAGLAASGRFLESATPPRFFASWAIVLRPIDGERTRLIERFRARMEGSTAGSKFLGPLLEFGMFVMIRKQMLGIRDRAERLARERAALHRDVDEVVARVIEAGPEAGPGAGPEAVPSMS